MPNISSTACREKRGCPTTPRPLADSASCEYGQVHRLLPAAGHSFIERLPQRGHLRLILLLFAFERPQSRPNHLARALMPSTLDPELTNRSSSSVRFTLRVGMLRAPAHHPAPIGKMTNLAFPKTPCANRLRPQSETGSVLSVHSVVNPAHARRPGMASSENQAQRRSPSASALERL